MPLLVSTNYDHIKIVIGGSTDDHESVNGLVQDIMNKAKERGRKYKETTKKKYIYNAIGQPAQRASSIYIVVLD